MATLKPHKLQLDCCVPSPGLVPESEEFPKAGPFAGSSCSLHLHPPSSPAQSLLPQAENQGLDAVLQRLGGPLPFWERVVDLLGEAVFIVGPDRRIVYWNHMAEQLTGYHRAEVVGMSCLRAVHCEVCEHRCGVFEFGDVRNVPLTLRDKNGRVLQVLKSATVIRDDQGQALVGIEVLRDMTEWNEREGISREARLAAQQEKALLKGVFDAVSDGIIVVSEQRQLRFLSASAMSVLGLTAGEAEGQEASKLLGNEVGTMVKHALAEKARVVRPRVILRRSDGGELPFAVAVAPMESAGGQGGAIVTIRDLREEERTLREGVRSAAFRFGSMVSRSSRMQELFDLVDQVAPTLATVLIQGESGTGKELVAREIHARSRRAGGPFHAVNCAAIASEILESEFFGHERGAFTGAVMQKPGRFELAHTGTLFLDEVGELPLDLQGKLLRVLEERSFERVGGTRTLQVDVRVIAATNRDLSEMVRLRSFREDLYYRLRVVPLSIPALRERIEDVELLAEHFLRSLGKREGKPALSLSSEALRLLFDHAWPGNVRELANAMEYAAVVSRSNTVRAEDLPRELRFPSIREEPAPRLSQRTQQDEKQKEEQALFDEKSRIETALRASHFSLAGAAELLGMHRTTLYRKRLRYGI